MSEKIVQFSPRRGGEWESGPDDPGLMIQVGRLEDAAVRMEASLARVEAGQQRQEVDADRMDGRFSGLEKLVASLPTTAQLLGLFLAVLVASGLLQWFGPRVFGVPAAQPSVSTTR